MAPGVPSELVQRFLESLEEDRQSLAGGSISSSERVPEVAELSPRRFRFGLRVRGLVVLALGGGLEHRVPQALHLREQGGVCLPTSGRAPAALRPAAYRPRIVFSRLASSAPHST